MYIRKILLMIFAKNSFPYKEKYAWGLSLD